MNYTITAGHFAAAKTFGRVWERFYWVNCRQDVQDWWHRWDVCVERKGPLRRQEAPMKGGCLSVWSTCADPLWSGWNFESALFTEMCPLLEMNRNNYIPPESDGMVERLNWTLEDQLAKFVDYHQRDWDKHILYLMMAYCASAPACWLAFRPTSGGSSGFSKGLHRWLVWETGACSSLCP